MNGRGVRGSWPPACRTKGYCRIDQQGDALFLTLRQQFFMQGTEMPLPVICLVALVRLVA